MRVTVGAIKTGVAVVVGLEQLPVPQSGLHGCYEPATGVERRDEEKKRKYDKRIKRKKKIATWLSEVTRPLTEKGRRQRHSKRKKEREIKY